MPTFFTMNADLANLIGSGDIDGMSGMQIHFDLELGQGDLLRVTGGPRPILLANTRRTTGYIRSDGRMYDTEAISAVPYDLEDPAGGSQPGEPPIPGIRLLASDPNLNLSTDVIYYVSGGGLLNGEPWNFYPFYTPAVPTTDTTIDLASFAPGPGHTLVGVPQLGLVDDLSDMTAVGKLIARAETAADARAALGGSELGGVLFAADNATAFRSAIDALSPNEMGDVVEEKLAEDSTVTAAAAAAAEDAVTADIAGRDLIEAGDPRTLQFTYIPGTGLVIHDAARRVLLKIAIDGSTKIAKLDMASIPAAGITASQLNAEIINGMVKDGLGGYIGKMPAGSGYMAAIKDGKRRVLFGVRDDGSIIGKFILPDNSITTAKIEPSLRQRIPPTAWTAPPVPQIEGTTPNRKLYINSADGTRRLAVDAGDPRDPEVLPDHTVLFDSDSGRRAVVDSGIAVPASSNLQTIAMWGDSLFGGYPPTEYPANGLPIPGVLDTLVAGSVVNLGIHGGAADEIAIRQGAYTLNLAVAGGSIPTSGAVTVTTTQGFGHRYDRNWYQQGKLANVSGLLTRGPGDPVGTMTFTRTTPGSAVAVAGLTPFVSDDAITHESNAVILGGGFNDIDYTPPSGVAVTDTVTRVLAAYDAMVARLRAYRKHFLIFGTITATWHTQGTTGYNQVVAINNQLAAKYGGRFIHVRPYLVSQCIHDLGITPDATDTAKMNADTLPPALMVAGDGIHFKAAVAAKIASAVLKPKLDEMGWTA